MRDKPHATMEHGHRVIPQYLGLHAQWLKRKPRQYPFEYLDPLVFWGAE